jgi:hypothetical protein
VLARRDRASGALRDPRGLITREVASRSRLGRGAARVAKVVSRRAWQHVEIGLRQHELLYEQDVVRDEPRRQRDPMARAIVVGAWDDGAGTAPAYLVRSSWQPSRRLC